ncbi:glutamate racemase [Desulfobotulus sp. H1]|uniref:Glutamate racemase n=1 Tax=Desulfobotulus pelophilus TaxID=2823377 RepID=A0ABT3N5I4_9BACT|nr:glutamate racemase [Desulfobotulus pelophilus]MCW7752719.1 glutamate racemase [Desulfobotulus pelophilus]
MIGIFDSGIGGLTTVRAIMQALPGYNILYYGDTARMPYGSKSPETVRQYAMENTRFLVENGAKIIIIACNSAASTAMEAVTASFHLPVFEVVDPAVQAAVNAKGSLRIGVIGTRATIRSGIYESKIKALRPDATVHSVPCPLLVPLVEEGWLHTPETVRIVKKYLNPLKTRQVTSLILGCTHYPILKKIIHRKIGKHVRIIDSGSCVAQTVTDYLRQHPDMDAQLEKTNLHRFYVSDITEQFAISARTMLQEPIRLSQIRM